MDLNPSSPLGLLILIIVIVAAAWLVLWAVQHFLPEVYQPARIIVGVCALLALLIALAGFFGVSTGATLPSLG